MKILVICQYYYPENFQITPICEQLASDGNTVTVLTGLPNYPTGRIPEEYKNKKRRREKINGVRVIRCSEIGRKKGALYLGLNYMSFYLSAMETIRKLRPDYDVVFTYQLSPILMGLPARWYAKKYKKPHFLYCCDLWPESLKMYVKSEKNAFYKYMKKVSRRVYASADKIAVQSKSFLDYLAEIHQLDREKMVYIPAFASEEYLGTDFLSEEDGFTDFVFLGNLGIAQDLSNVVKAFEKAATRTDRIRLHLVGDGSCFDELKDAVKAYGIEDKVLFYGRRPVEEMPSFYKLADACIVSLKADNATGHTLPSKVQGYMAAGKPIIGMINGSAKEVIEESGCGICVAAGDVKGLEDAFCEFAENRENYKSCGEKGRNYFIHNFRKDIFMDSLEKQLKQVQKERH